MTHNHNITSASDADILKDALVGRSVVSVTKGPGFDHNNGPAAVLVLDDGTILQMVGNGPHCACSAGEYDLTELNEMPLNGITNVELVHEYTPDKWEGGRQVFRIFVIAFDGGRSPLAVFEGDDGNGYYGSGFWVQVIKPGLQLTST